MYDVDISKIYNLIDSYLNESVSFYKIVSSDSKWYYSNYIFDNRKYNDFFEFGMIKRKYVDSLLINSIKFLDKNNFKSIILNGNFIFIYTNYPIERYGIRYVVRNSIIISEDIYNLVMIKNNCLDLLTKDISYYKEYLNVNKKLLKLS